MSGSRLAGAALALALSASVEAQQAQELAGLFVSDGLAAERLGRATGSAELKIVLDAEGPARGSVLTALRLAAFVEAPEVLVPSLCRWAGGRDPELAPAAARALIDIADRLDPRALAAREASLGSLREARTALGELMGRDPAPRADIVFAAGYADAAFAQVLAQVGPLPAR